MTNAELFKKSFPSDVAGAMAAVKAAGGKLTWQNSTRCSRVDWGEVSFPDGSLFTVRFHEGGYHYGGRTYAADVAG